MLKVTLASELSLFASTFTVLGLITSKNKKMWTNPTLQSVRFCRPLRIAIEKETATTTELEKKRLDVEVDHLQPHTFSLPNGKKVTVNFNPDLTMVDGKCLNSIVGNNCTIRCSCVSKQWTIFIK